MPNIIEIKYPNIKFRKKNKNIYTRIVTIRIDKKEYKLIRNVCDYLGITPSFFFRWCAYYSAKNIKNDARDKNKCLNLMKNKEKQ